MSILDLRNGDCLEVLKSLDDNSVDSIVTDPPYGLSFMGRKWDYDVPSVEVWRECLRVLKPGGHLLAFAGTRTQHRMCVNIEDAGFEIRDMIAWVYGSGFPKSMDISKAIDKAAGAERERYECPTFGGTFSDDGGTTYGTVISNTPVTPEAAQWKGWGTALKPALEPITVARKPFKGTVAQNVLEHGTGGINIDACRVGGSETMRMTGGNAAGKDKGGSGNSLHFGLREPTTTNIGRWPANLIHDGSDEPCELLGNAQRFFYCAKTSKADREDGNIHPTVKPTDLMAYLCRLVPPPGGVVLDPFMGSGSTGKAAMREGFGFIGIEREAEYFEIAQQRVKSNALAQLDLLPL